MSGAKPLNSEERIAKFLQDYPVGPLQVAVGQVSVWGLAWLHRHTQNRHVNLLVGDAQPRHFERDFDSATGPDSATNTDRRQALEFLRRDDVSVSIREQKRGGPADGPADAHPKGWVSGWLVLDKGKAHLLTSSVDPTQSNLTQTELTQQGLQQSRRPMVEAAGDDLERSVARMKEQYENSWDCRQRLNEYVSGEAAAQNQAQHGWGQQSWGQQDRAGQNWVQQGQAMRNQVLRNLAFMGDRMEGCLLWLAALATYIPLVGLFAARYAIVNFWRRLRRKLASKEPSLGAFIGLAAALGGVAVNLYLATTNVYYGVLVALVAVYVAIPPQARRRRSGERAR